MHSRPWLRTTELTLLFLLAMQLRVINLNHEPHWDEFYHYFAAKSAAAEGTLQIDAGEYSRASFYTYLVASLFQVFGPSFAAARLVSVVAGSLTVVAIAMWTCRVAGPVAGIVAGLLMCFSWMGIDLSQFARFYALHGLCIWLGAVFVYTVVVEPASAARKAGLITAAAALFLLALHLQPTTLIALAGLSVWLAFWVIRRWCQWAKEGHRRRCLVCAVVSVAAVATIGWLCRETLWDLLHQYRYTAAWLAYRRDDVAFYHRMLLGEYRTLYCLLPVGLVFALWGKPKPTSFCLCMFVVAMLLHSGAAQKHPRYVAYAVPFLFAVWGIILSQVVEWGVGRLKGTRFRLPARMRSPRVVAVLTPVLVIVVAMSVAVTNRSFPFAAMTIVTSHLRPSWNYARPVLEPLAETSDVIVSSTDLKPLYYLGRPCIVLGSQFPSDREGTGSEFASGRTGRCVISKPESLDALIESHPSGLVIVERDHWRRRAFVSPEAADYLVNNTRAVPLPKNSRLIAFRWDRSDRRENLARDPELVGVPLKKAADQL